MRIALIGTGRIGQLHARVLADHPLVDELLVADLDPASAARAARALGARAADVDEAIEAADGLAIATSSNSHPELIRAGLARRIPIFCEKPIALDMAETTELVDEIEASGIPFQLGFHRRFDPAYRQARTMVVDGTIGRLYQVRMTAMDHNPPPESYVPTSGGFFRDSSIHDFDAIRFVTGDEVDSVYADGGALGFDYFAKHGDVDTAVATLRMRSGMLGVLAGGRHNPPGYDIRMELVGSLDAVAIGLGVHTPIHPLDGDAPALERGWVTFLDRFADAYRAELSAFVEVADGRAESACTARDGLEAMRIAEAAARSIAERRPVQVHEIALKRGEKEVRTEVISH
ncbi:MAG TPA: Gfo/Idh/MocA family oxidoreductase [Candidatus Dormibacteraeota bacterium]|nr:Gfo/Idh/MocA family oxidoreductase [Candidatus Dormibacteraeota bacterium]